MKKLLALPLAALALTACGGTETKTSAPAAAKVTDPLVTTYDGGLQILDRATLKVVQDIPLPGFNRVNAAGDGRHVLVSTATGFRVLDATGTTLRAEEFAAPKPGHVVRHAGRTVLFSDGTGKIMTFDPRELGTTLPKVTTHTSEHPHHGVAIRLKDGRLISTLGTEDERTGIRVLDTTGKEITRNEQCPGVHGEAAAKDEAVVIGCENGVLLYAEGKITKIASPDEYGRIGNQAGHDESPIVLGDYKTDPDAELERPERISLINTATGKLRLLDLGASYTFRSLGRGPHGEALVLGTDGALRIIDPESAKATRKIKILAPWTEPTEWQEARPTLHVAGGTAYVTDPAAKKLHAVTIESGKLETTADLPKAPNEITTP
ncbi:zinc metallochaperone AztD [Spirillospora sp. NPDC048911]|uniref:zinc metallochaperone AztD n=1 Tax=Spirillospora sp. NPDC048911 TaxID=3364527 RepID=UPI0037178448